MVSLSHEQRHVYARNKVKLRDNKVRKQLNSRTKPDRGSICIRIGPAKYSTLNSIALAKYVFKRVDLQKYCLS